MQTRLLVLDRVYLDHAAHLASILGRYARRINAHRLHIIRFECGTKAGRAIVSERNAIENKLRLIFRTRAGAGLRFLRKASPAA